MSCNCEKDRAQEAEVATVELESIETLRVDCEKAAKKLGPSSAAPVITQVHFTPTGDALTSSSVAGENEGTVVLKGAIGPIPYEIHIKLSIEDGVVSVTLEVKKPFKIGPFTWKFRLRGLVKNAEGQIVGASGLVAVDTSGDVSALGLNWWCVLKCGGLSILGTLVTCLPSLAGGVPAYVACVTGKLGSSAAKIAVCIATKCA